MIDNRLASERQRIILERAQRDGQVLITQLAEEFGVSGETIRRDINRLSEENCIHKVHGGAVPVAKNQQEAAREQRATQNLASKQAIGEYAAGFIEDNDVVAFDSGVTTDWLAQAVKGVNNVTIILNSVSALNILIQKHNNGEFTGKIIFLGGEVHCQNYYTIGGLTTNMLLPFSVDKTFFSATSISVSGPRMYDVNDGLFTSMLVEKAAISYLLADSSKFGKEALYKICNFSDIQHIITDDKYTLSPIVEKAISAAGVCLHITGGTSNE